MTVEEFMAGIAIQISEWDISQEIVDDALQNLADEGDVSKLTIDKVIIDFEHKGITLITAQFPDKFVTIM